MRRTAIAILARAFFLACWLALAGPTLAAGAPATSAPIVAAGADMTLALKEIDDSFYKQTNKKVSLSFGASAAQAQKIAEGAPVRRKEPQLTASRPGAIKPNRIRKYQP